MNNLLKTTLIGLFFGTFGTTIGGIIGVTVKNTSKKFLSFILAFASGLMISIVCFDLIPEAFNLTGILNGSFSFRGEGLMLAAAASYGISNVYLKKIVKQESPMAITSYQILFGSLLMIIIGICMGGRVQVYSLKAACLLLYLAALSAAAFSIWTLLLKYNPVGKVTMFAFSIPVFGVIMSGIFLGESVFSMKNIIALVLVSVGIGVVNAKHGEQHYL